MAQFSYRTGSFNNFFGSNENTQIGDYKRINNSPVRRIASSSNHKIRIHQSPQVCPSTPLINRASEAHINRIRYATSRVDFKRNSQISVAPMINAKSSQNGKISSGSDSDDVESVDWTAPLDITAYLYKPEYIISPSSKTSMEDAEQLSALNDKRHNKIDNRYKANASNVSVSSSKSTLQLPEIHHDNSYSTKEELVNSYVRNSMRGDRRKFFDRNISDYTAFVKELQNELREVSQETKRLEIQSPRTRNRKQEDREEIIHRGYVTLKRIYELNPELTESAARKNICGPPGNHWMGLSRVEVLEIMRRIRKELGVPPDKYDNDDPRMNFLRRNKDKKMQKKGKGKSKKNAKKLSQVKERKTKQTVKVKAPVVPVEYVPGPKHLHTNVCIRPWEATLDGWSPDKDRTNGQESCHESNADFDNPPNSPREFIKSTSQSSLLDSNQSSQDNDEDFITLEIFNPIFKVSR